MKRREILVLTALVMALGLVIAGCSTSEQTEEPLSEETESMEKTEDEVVEDPDNPTPLAGKTRNPEEIFRFETTALYGEGGETINPTGMLLNIGCEDCQDIFYASRTLTVQEVVERLKKDFGVEEMLEDENFVRFDIDLDMVRKLEMELDLIAANKLENESETVDIRIISIVPE